MTKGRRAAPEFADLGENIWPTAGRRQKALRFRRARPRILLSTAALSCIFLCHMVGLPPSLPGVSGDRVILLPSYRERNSSGNQNF